MKSNQENALKQVIRQREDHWRTCPAGGSEH
jgi:hypothetical protein